MKRKVVITSGGTAEYIDGVRKITNMSTGALGVEIAEKLKNEYEVIFITSSHCLKPTGVRIEIANSAEEVMKKLKEEIEGKDIYFVIHSMAISDYTVESVMNEDGVMIDREKKISSINEKLILTLKKTEKIIDKIKEWNKNVYLIGFKLLNKISEEELISVAENLKEKVKAEFIIANDLSDIKNDMHKAFLISDEKFDFKKKEISKKDYPIMSNKKEIAGIIEIILKRKEKK